MIIIAPQPIPHNFFFIFLFENYSFRFGDALFSVIHQGIDDLVNAIIAVRWKTNGVYLKMRISAAVYNEGGEFFVGWSFVCQCRNIWYDFFFSFLFLDSPRRRGVVIGDMYGVLAINALECIHIVC